MNEGRIHLFFLENNSILMGGDQQHKDMMDSENLWGIFLVKKMQKKS